MASPAQMSRVATDPAAVRAMAEGLLRTAGRDFSEWELDFLEHMANWAGREPLSERQREKLFELVDDAREYRTVQGMAVARLVAECHAARADLDEEMEAFVVRLAIAGTVRLKRRPLIRLLCCARQLGLVEGYVDLERSRWL